MTNDQLNEISMDMLSCSGKAKKLLSEAIDQMTTPGHDESPDEKLIQAHQLLTQAHRWQNLVIKEANQLNYSLLFTHAQDTLMNTETIEFIIKKLRPALKHD